jgi:redox-sensitive bicupin YhaK (pirin superfamily)
MTVPTQTSRSVAGVINSVETLEGAGFLVRRPFPKSSFSEFDPFLLLDELGPINLKPGFTLGFGIVRKNYS